VLFNEFSIITLQAKEYLLKKSLVLFQRGILLMITSSVLFGIAIALSGSIAISSFEFGNATNSIKGNQFVDTPGPWELGKSCIR
jgi:hypothetical protein